ncbi:hypothetical protein JHK85_025852 [Glycine max]|nr:hypothetical protein JHK85_025852 [Glycine max]
MPSSKTLLLITNLTLLSFATTEAQNDPFYLYKDCSSDKTSPNTSFQFNLKNLLSSLSSNATRNTPFYNTTINGENPSDSIYGLFMCRADVSSHLCQLCVLNATQQLSSECSLSKQAVIWYEECMVWYSTSSIFSSVATTPSSPMKNSGKVPKPERFMRLVFRTINQTADEASFQSSIGNNKFATKEATNVSGISQTQTLYCLAQCTPNLSPHDCRTCLDDAIRKIQECCEGRIGGRVLFPSCNVRYEMYPFYNVRSATPVPKLIPETKTSHADSNLSEFPIYLSHNCTNKTFNANNSAFQTHLTTLLFNLASNATTGNKFYTADVANTVFGLFLCRDQEDLPSGLCGECVKNATHEISSKCGSFHEAIIWYSQCMLRYSYRNFFNEMETGPVFSELNTTNKDDEQNFFTMKLAKALDQAAIQAGDSDEKYGKRTTKLNDLQTLYALAQCTQNLSIEDCKGCLGIVIGTSIPWSRLGSIGGRVLYPSCNIRFELFQFYKDNDKSGTSSSPDFGLARIVEINQDQGSTSVIVGTYGYMSPEYAMFGQFSEKSDVFSFGVMVLEIISGKKNFSSYESHRITNGLLSYVWKQWSDHTPLNTLDPDITENYSEIEVIKCIQIGLLCVQQDPDARPTMVTVASYLTSHPIELPTPQEPAFFLHGRMDENAVANESNFLTFVERKDSLRLFRLKELQLNG